MKQVKKCGASFPCLEIAAGLSSRDHRKRHRDEFRYDLRAAN
jgi:hypothetical protein